MKHAALAVLLMAGAPTAALAQAAGTAPDPSKDAATMSVTDLGTGQVTIVYDETLSDEFEVGREIVDRVQAEFGEHAVYDSGQDLPQGIDAALEPGNMLPEGAEVSAVPEQLGDLPTLGQGTKWVAVGEHLVEVTPDNIIVMVVYDALP